MIITLKDINNDYGGFARLIDFAETMSGRGFENIQIDMSEVNWFSANMCAAFGAILYKAGREMNKIRLSNFTPDVKESLSKNGFLSYYGRVRSPDTFETTIEYKRFETKDEQLFAFYVESDLFKKKGLPFMSSGLRKKFMEGLFEIFNNSVTHSQTILGIFSCGQYFPQQNRLFFSIVDLGIGFRDNLNEKLNRNMFAEQAIEWAVEGKNTTKTGKIPGGLGLKLLREFILMNKGKIQIISDRGYWESSHMGALTKSFPHPFPGTIVNLEFNTADTNSYYLKSDIDVEDIF